PHPSASIALEERERGPRIGIELPLAVSSSGPGLVEMERAFVAHCVQTYEVERPQGDVAKIFPARRLTKREQREGRLGIPGRELLEIHGRRRRAAPLARWQSVIGGTGGLAALETPPRCLREPPA